MVLPAFLHIFKHDIFCYSSCSQNFDMSGSECFGDCDLCNDKRFTSIHDYHPNDLVSKLIRFNGEITNEAKSVDGLFGIFAKDDGIYCRNLPNDQIQWYDCRICGTINIFDGFNNFSFDVHEPMKKLRTNGELFEETLLFGLYGDLCIYTFDGNLNESLTVQLDAKINVKYKNTSTMRSKYLRV